MLPPKLRSNAGRGGQTGKTAWRTRVAPPWLMPPTCAKKSFPPCGCPLLCRRPGDRVGGDDLWPLPSYQEMLSSVEPGKAALRVEGRLHVVAAFFFARKRDPASTPIPANETYRRTCRKSPGLNTKKQQDVATIRLRPNTRRSLTRYCPVSQPIFLPCRWCWLFNKIHQGSRR
jgi:hypothetical protein